MVNNVDGRPRAAAAKLQGRGWAYRFFHHLIHELANDNLTDNGAMMTYYAILALFPMIVFVVAIALVILPDATVIQGLTMATEAMPSATREVVTAQVMALLKAQHTGFAIGGAALALWGARGGVSALMGALNAMFNERETRSWWKRQLIAIAVTLGVAILIVLALVLLVVGPAAGHWLADRFGLGPAFDVAWDTGRWVGAGLLIMIVWSALYTYLPNRRARFRVFTPGAVIGVLLWLGISYAFSFYLGSFANYATTYGALGGAIIFLTWLWLSNIALLFGAEINDVLQHMSSTEADAVAAEATPSAAVSNAPGPTGPAA